MASLPQPRDPRARIAIDLGAESCRVSLLRWREGVAEIELVHRFGNAPTEGSGALHWPLQQILDGIHHGLRRAAEIAREGVASLAVDGWAVDYVHLNDAGEAVGAPFCYRDARTIASAERVHARIPAPTLFARTGIQPLRINTLYQIVAEADSAVAHLPWVCLPEFVLLSLGATRVAEYTNATHTGLVDPLTRDWAWDLFRDLDLDAAAAPPIVAPGTKVGKLRGRLAGLPAFRDTDLIAPACHDTASAVSTVPPISEGAAYISSGTWSLVGVLATSANASQTAYDGGFTNLGGIGGRICFHKNVTGMWLVKQCLDHWHQSGAGWAIDALIDEAARLPDGASRIDVDAPELMLPGDMPARLNRQLAAAGFPEIQDVPSSAPQFARLIFASLAERYATVLKSLERQQGRTVERIHVVGGGARNALLNALTREQTGKDVICCAPESSTLGNFAIQLAADMESFDPKHGVQVEEVLQWANRLAMKVEP